jgi:hypothetical protein
VHTTWSLRRTAARGRVSADVLFPSWGSEARVTARMRDGSTREVGYVRIPLAQIARLQVHSRHGGYVVLEGAYPNGRLYKLALNPSDPKATATLSILPGANFDDNGYRNAASPHNPDNVETTKSAIWFQEDPGGHQQFTGATNARIWRYDLQTHQLKVVAEVDQSPSPVSLPVAAWESSGIVDVSRIFGPGSFLVDVQAHGWDLPAGTGNDAPAVPKREMGQLLLLKVPGEQADAPATHGKGKEKGKRK